jgi:ribosome-binding factor A
MALSRSAKGRSRSPAHKAGSQKSPQGRSQRQLRVGEELRHALSQVLARGELRDPHLTDVSLTVTEVRVSPDLKNATAFVVPLGGGDLEAVVAALNHAASFLRGQLGHEVRLRYTPRLSFQADHSFDEAAHINDILHHPRVARDVHADDAAGGRDDSGDESDGE